MKYLSATLMLLVLLTLSSLNSHAQEEQVVTNSGEITIYAKSKNVWKVLTNTKKYAKIMGYKWKSGKEIADAVGDQALLEFLEQETAYEVTFIEPGNKITVKVVPSTTHYVNEKTWDVIPVDKWTTRVKVTDVYTLPAGEIPPAADQQINTLQKRLEKLRDLAER